MNYILGHLFSVVQYYSHFADGEVEGQKDKYLPNIAQVVCGRAMKKVHIPAFQPLYHASSIYIFIATLILKFFRNI